MDGHPEPVHLRCFAQKLHQLDEFGTEAAAATAVVVSRTSMPTEPVNLNIDRPFLFTIPG